MKKYLFFCLSLVALFMFVMCEDSNPSGTDTSDVDTLSSDFLQDMKDHFSGEVVVDSSYRYFISDSVIAIYSAEETEEDTIYLTQDKLDTEVMNLGMVFDEEDSSGLIYSESWGRIFNNLILGTGNTVEENLWQMDSVSVRLALDLSSMGADTAYIEKDTSSEDADLLYFNPDNSKLYRVYQEGNTLFEIDSLINMDSTEMASIVISSCPYAFLNMIQASLGAVSPVTEIDTVNSNCDTTYAGYRENPLSTEDPVESYITDNGSGVITVYSVAEGDSIGEVSSLFETLMENW